MSMCSLLLCCWKRVFAMTSLFSWHNSVSLCSASFCTPRSNLPITPVLLTFAFQSPMMKRTSSLGVSSRRSYRCSSNHSTSASSALLFRAQTVPSNSKLNGLCWFTCKLIFRKCLFHLRSDILHSLRIG